MNIVNGLIEAYVSRLNAACSDPGLVLEARIRGFTDLLTLDDTERGLSS